MKSLTKAVFLLLCVVSGAATLGLSLSAGPHIVTAIKDWKTMLGPDTGAMTDTTDSGASREPLYWVAPMDPKYRRDKPGKSPMGMDLVPVYDDGGDAPAGTVKISPEVINNLGVRTAAVELARMNDEVEATGIVGFDMTQHHAVHARVSGWITRLNAQSDGDRIKRYDRLYDIHSPELIAAQEEMLVALNANDVRLVEASVDKLRNLGVSKGSIKRIRENRKVINNITVYAPVEGVVGSLAVGEGAYVTPGTRLMTLTGMDPVWVETEVFESQLGKVKLGSEVLITTPSLPGQSWLGKVDYLYPELDATTRTAKLRVVVENPHEELLPQMYVRAKIDATAEHETLSIHREALISTGSMDRVVLVTGSGQYKSIEVEPGRRSRDRIEILKGLTEGDEVVVSAQFLIDSESSISSDFMRMEPMAEQPETAWATGTVLEVYADESIALIQHDPVTEWQWPAMEMEFSYGDNLPVESFTSESVRFNMRKLESGAIQIEAIESAGSDRQ